MLLSSKCIEYVIVVLYVCVCVLVVLSFLFNTTFVGTQNFTLLLVQF